MVDDKLTLRMSQAGMRFIAQMTIYNSGDFERLQKYIQDSYHPDLLAEQPPEARLAAFRTWQAEAGKFRVQQVLGTSKHHVIILLVSELTDDFWLNDLSVEEDYPHRITAYSTSLMD